MKMRTTICFALLGLLAVVGRAGAQMIGFDAAVRDRIGVNIHFSQPAPGEMGVLAAVGCGWIRQDLTWNATELKPGEYKLKVEGSQAVFTDAQSAKSFSVPVKIENTGKKFANTAVESTNQDGMDNIQAIDLGGSNTRLAVGQ